MNYVIDIPSTCKNGHDLVIKRDFYIDKRWTCRHDKEYQCKGKYSCSRCTDSGNIMTLTKNLDCAMCDRIKMLKEKSPDPPGPWYEFHLNDLKCNGHYIITDYCKYTCYDCKVNKCYCVDGIDHCCCHLNK